MLDAEAGQTMAAKSLASHLASESIGTYAHSARDYENVFDEYTMLIL